MKNDNNTTTLIDMSLGDRMKNYYEFPFKIKIPMRLPVILRLDGRAFHTLTIKLDRPFSEEFISLMQLTARHLCENIQGAVFGFVQSDEISILLHNFKRLNSHGWFGNNIQKMVSISASLASSFFSINSNKVFGDQKLAEFDSRVFVLPESEVCNYFIWRQQDWERNSIQMLAQSLYSHKELQKKNNNELQEMCFEKDVNWNDLPIHLKRGTGVRKIDAGLERFFDKWIIDEDIPIFTKDRNYIENLLTIDED
jgi:tRNA(His) 5'-end guanylyltransferase